MTVVSQPGRSLKNNFVSIIVPTQVDGGEKWYRAVIMIS